MLSNSSVFLFHSAQILGEAVGACVAKCIRARGPIPGNECVDSSYGVMIDATTGEFLVAGGMTVELLVDRHSLLSLGAPSKEAVMRTHERAGHPTDEVYEITATA